MATPCLYSDKINETHKILTGNGNPENGICRQVALISERQKGVLIELKEINANHNVLLGEITRVGNDLIKLESSINGKEKAELNAQAKSRDTWYKWLTLIGIVVMIGLATWNHFTSNNNSKEITASKDTLRNEIRMTKGIPKLTRDGWLIINRNGLTDSVKVLNVPINDIINSFKK